MGRAVGSRVIPWALAAAWLGATSAGAGWRDLQRSEPPPPVVPESVPTVAVVSPAAREPDPATATAPIVIPTAADAAAGATTPGSETDAGAPAADPGPGAEAADAGPGSPGATGSGSLRDFTKRDLDIRVEGVVGSAFPEEACLPEATFEPRRFPTTTFTWKAAGYCHKPLYFEHWNLERYGHSHGFVADSFLSAAHFFARIPALPYQVGVEMPWECVYPLGYYRPGSCAPWTVPAVPVSGRGLAVGAAGATGLVFLLP